MWEIVAYQYKITNIILKYIMDNILPYYGSINPEFNELYPKFFDLSQTMGFLFLATFIISLVVFLFWRLLGKLCKFEIYNIDKYRMTLLLNIFYIVPFVYGFMWWRLKLINISLLFIWSWSYYIFKWFFINPDRIIKYFI